MAYSFVQYIGDGATQPFSFTFPYITLEHIEVRLDGVLQTLTTDYTFPTGASINMVVAPPVDSVLEIRRNTPKVSRVVDFQDGSILTEAALDQDSNQLLYIAQEAFDTADNTIQLDADNTFDALNKRIKNVAAPTADTDAANKTYVDTGVLVHVAAAAAEAAASAASASASAASAVDSDTAKTAAEAAQASAEAVYDAFDDRYLGSKAADPTLDNDGNALIDGALYFNTSVIPGEMRVYDLSTTTWKAAYLPTSAYLPITNEGTPNIDVNTLLTPGFYTVPSSLVNGPWTGNTGSILVTSKSNDDNVSQLAFRQPDTANRELYFRTYGRASGWSAWEKLNGKADNASTQTIFIPASAFYARDTNGAAPGSSESPTNKVMQKGWDFDAAVNEYIQARIALPKGVVAGATLTGRFFWDNLTNVSGNVVWAFQLQGRADASGVDLGYAGAAPIADDTGANADRYRISAETTAASIGGSSAAEQPVTIQVYRDAVHASDTATADARFLGIVLKYTTTSLNDA